MGLTYLPINTVCDEPSSTVRFTLWNGRRFIMCAIGGQTLRKCAGVDEGTLD
jgi:hypothetical protein